MSLTTMNPATRRLIKVNSTDIEQTAYVFDMLLGDNLQEEKSISRSTAMITSIWLIFHKERAKIWLYTFC